MRWRRKISLSRRLRKIIYVALVSVMISLAIYNQIGENVSTNSSPHSISLSDQVILPKSTKLNKGGNLKINRSLKRLSINERVSNVHYVTIDPHRTTRRIASQSLKIAKVESIALKRTRESNKREIVKLENIESKRKKESQKPEIVKVESVELKRTKENHKRAIRSKFQYTQMSIVAERDGLFNTHNIVPNNKIQKKRDSKKFVGKSAAFIRGSIRFYVKPEWFSTDDIESMATLSAKDVIRVENANLNSNNWKTLLFNKDDIQQEKLQRNEDSNVFHGLTSHSLTVHEVLAFHLDRVLGLGRVLPTVAKRFTGTTARHLNIPDNLLHSVISVDNVDIQPVDGLIKENVLACKNIQLSDTSNKCGDIDGLEWGKLALFDFLLQIHNRLNQHCCGFQPDSNNKCLITMDTNDCSTNRKLGIVHKVRNNNQLIFLKNEMNIKSSGNSVDFELLEGVRKFPIRAVDIIRKGKLKLMLLQSLFIDKAYWDGVGGRVGVEQMINVIVDRARLFIKYYDTHMNVQ